jgi:hypothetical protein
MPFRAVAMLAASCPSPPATHAYRVRSRVVTPIPRRVLPAVALLALIACGDGTGPDVPRVELAAAAGDRQFGEAGATLEEPLQVTVSDAATRRPVDGVDVSWRVVSGAGTLTATSTTTDDIGVASVMLRLGTGTDPVRIEANAPGNVAGPALFEALVVSPPVIHSIAPTTIAPGAPVTITGQGFLPMPADNAVLFGGIRGTVTSASSDQLVVTAPTCLQSRTVEVRVFLGQVPSPPVDVQTAAPPDAPLTLAPGQATRITGNDIRCVRLGGAAANDLYVLIPQNASDVLGLPIAFELIGRVGQDPPITLDLRRSGVSFAADWEAALRSRERSFTRGAGTPADAILPQASRLAQEPRIGDRRQFNVLNSEEKSERITAEVRAISTRAIMYVDVDAPANGFSQQDLTGFGAIFDDPIYSTDVSVFGTPTDVDGNGRIIILFTPRVNALTERGQDGFVAGYFYGCDLVDSSRCADTNRAEIFYSIVPDPEGRFGDVRTRTVVQRTVPGILAHEFQHMIHFGEKGALDALWLSEGLAHAAEDIVGRVFLERGQNTTAADFRNPNFGRANRYLTSVSSISLLGENSPGTLELRGGAWLLIEHLASHYGEDVLGRLTRTSRNGVANIVAETSQPWVRLISDFAVALWADDSPDLVAVNVAAHLTFPRLNLRTQIGQFQGGFPLQPPTASFADFRAAGTLAAAAQDYLLLRATTPSPPPLSLTFTGNRGAPFAGAAQPQLTILRVR